MINYVNHKVGDDKLLTSTVIIKCFWFLCYHKKESINFYLIVTLTTSNIS